MAIVTGETKRKRKTPLEWFLTVFGDIKVFKWPMFMLYHPIGYGVKGEDIREALETIRPGDILVRGYRDYLDGHFIPGYFSHVGLYIGEVTEADRPGVTEASEGLQPGGDAHFRTGKQMVIHALAEGVIMEDVINFCRCDYMAILRFPAELRRLPTAWKPLVNELSAPEQKLFDRLAADETVSFADALPCVRAAALGKLGSAYDFKFDFRRFDTLSCSELVYWATKSLGAFLNVDAENRRVLFMKRSMIPPDAFVRSPLEVAWKSRSVAEHHFTALRAAAARLPAPAPAVSVPLSRESGRGLG